MDTKSKNNNKHDIRVKVFSNLIIEYNIKQRIYSLFYILFYC